MLRKSGLTNPIKVTEKQVDEDRQLNNRLADVNAEDQTGLTKHSSRAHLRQRPLQRFSAYLESDKFKTWRIWC